MKDRIKIAIQKNGRLSSDSLSLLKKCGVEFTESKNMLFIKSTNMPVDLLMVRDDDIPRLVSQKIADLGIVGENVVMEKQLSDKELEINQKLKLGFSKCRLSFASITELIREIIFSIHSNFSFEVFLDDINIASDSITLSNSTRLLDSNVAPVETKSTIISEILTNGVSSTDP